MITACLFQLGQHGSGEDEEGLSNFQIDRHMAKFKSKGYLGCIASDEITSKILPKVSPLMNQGSFIMNLDTADGPGYHWVACYFTPHIVEYYNSFGKPPTASFISQMKQVMKKVDPDGLFKIKVNHIQRQGNNTTDCGYHAMKFIQDRIAGRSFATSTGYDDHLKDDHVNGEKAVTKFIKHMHGGAFLHTYQTEQEGEGVIDALKAGAQRLADIWNGVRKTASPSIRKFTKENGSAIVTKIVVCRQPVTPFIEKVATLISLGKWDANKKKLGYDKMLHLFMIITLNNGKTFKLEKNHLPEISSNTTIPKDHMNVGKSPNISWADFLYRAERTAGGDRLYVYDAIRANCQNFVHDCLKGADVLTPELNKYIMQNATAVIEGLPWFEKLARKLTDTRNVLDVAQNGGNENILPTTIEPSNVVNDGQHQVHN